MAIYHLRLTPVKKAGTTIARSAHHGGHRLTRGALGKAAYLAGERHAALDGNVVDYRSKADGVEHSQLILPGGGTAERGQLWNAIDNYPTQRETATIARDLIVAFPHELRFSERKAAAVALGRWISHRYGVAVDLGMHKPDLAAGSNERNFHGHYLISERRVSLAGEIGLVNRELNQMACVRRDAKRGRTEPRQTAAAEIRTAWQRIANDALERGGHRERIDCRSYREQGIDREATEHRGAAATKRLREEERARTAARGTGQTPEQQIRTVAALRSDLLAAERELTGKCQAASERVAALRAERKTAPLGAALTGELGSLQGWIDDPTREFLRAWEAADRAGTIRRKLRQLEHARPILRPPTPEEAAELRSASRERARLQNLCERVREASGHAAALPPETRLNVGERPMTRAQLAAIERELARHNARTPGRRSAQPEQEAAFP